MFAKCSTASFIFIFLGAVWHFYFLFYSRVRMVTLSSYYHPFDIILEPEGPLRGHMIKELLGVFPLVSPGEKVLETLECSLASAFQCFVTMADQFSSCAALPPATSFSVYLFCLFGCVLVAVGRIFHCGEQTL